MTKNELTPNPCAEPRIAICTALPEELAACRLMIDGLAALNADHPDDGNQYWCGTLPSRGEGNPHRVLLTSLVKMGNNVAASAVTNLIRSFPSIEFVLMVGIAGGIPNPRKRDGHVRLGDVVVTDEQGILQYDNVKRTETKIQIRDNSPKPGARLIGAVKALESDFILGELSLEEYLSKAIHLPVFRRPLPETDQLFDPKNAELQVPHPEDIWRTSHPDLPRIHRGAIGSANTLLKDPVLRDSLRDEHGVRAIEMEGSGIADGTWSVNREYLVIRGICDYCDSHKNDDWHYYAALAAAAYARALIENIADFPPSHRNDSRPVTSAYILDSGGGQPSAATDISADEVDRLRSELGEVYVRRLEPILELRGRGESEAAWTKLSEELAALATSSVPKAVQARYFYHAARFAQEDDKPADQSRRFLESAQRLNPELDDRTYRAYEAARNGNIDVVIETLHPFNTESVCVNLCRHLLNAGRWGEVDGLLGPPDASTTDEVRRMRAICRLASGDLAGAWTILEPTLDRHQESPLFLLTGCYVAFWQAVPPDLHRPGDFGPGLFTPGIFRVSESRRKRLQDSFRFCQQALSLLPAGSRNILRRDARAACIAVGLAIPQHQSDALILAEEALAEEPKDPIAASALLRMRYTRDWEPTVSALGSALEGAKAKTADTLLLVDVLLNLKKPQEAWNYLERTDLNQISADEHRHWFERSIRALYPLGRLAELEPRLSDLGDFPEDQRLRAAYWSLSEETEKVRDTTETLIDTSGTLIDHVNLVSLHRMQKEWLELAFSARCCLRQFPDASTDVIDALAIGWLELGNPAEALRVLEDYRVSYELDGLLDTFLARKMFAHGALGQYPEAFAASESLWQGRQSADLLLRRAHLQFLQGDAPQAIEILKRGIEDGFVSPQNLIFAASLLTMSNREEAFQFARQAVERYPDDPQLRVNAMQIGFTTGHGDWAHMQLVFLTQRFPDSGLFQEASPPMLLELVLQGKEREVANWKVFASGRVPFHLWADSTNRGLGAEFYWRWNHNRDHPPAEHTLLPSAYGGRSVERGFRAWKERTLTMDYTGWLSAYLLKLIPSLESAFDVILIAPSLLALIQRELLDLSKAQSDFTEKAEILSAKLNGERVAVTLLPTPHLEPEGFALQFVDRVVWRLAEDHGLWIITDKFVTERFDNTEVPEALAARKVPPQAVFEALRAQGEILDDSSPELETRQLATIGEHRRLPAGSRLLVDQPFLYQLLDENAFEAATSNFHLYCLESIREDLAQEIRAARYRLRVKSWLEGLLQELRRLSRKKQLSILTTSAGPPAHKAHDLLTGELSEVISGAEDAQGLVWIDDRHLTSYARIGAKSHIINVSDVLGMLKARSVVSKGKYLQCHRELIKAGMAFRLPPSDYVFDELQSLKLDQHSSSLHETQPLSLLRQSIRASLSVDSSIGTEALRSAMPTERDQFIMELRGLTEAVMGRIWTAENITNPRRMVMAHWVYYQLLPNEARIARDPIYQNDLVQGLAVEHSARISLFVHFLERTSAIRAYFEWLFADLDLAWRNQGDLRKRVVEHYTDLVLAVIRELQQDGADRDRLRPFLGAIRFLPHEMTTALFAHGQLGRTLGGFLQSGAFLEPLGLFVPEMEWSEIVNRCVSAISAEGQIVHLQGQRLEVVFLRRQAIGDALVVTGQTSTGRPSSETIMSPFVRLEHPESTERLAWLDELVDGRLLARDISVQWRDRLGSDDWTEAADAIKLACQRSMPYFFKTAALTLGIPNLAPDDGEFILPQHWEVLCFDASVSDARRDFLLGRGGGMQDAGVLESEFQELAVLPYGAPGGLAWHLRESVDEDKLSVESVHAFARLLRSESRNPVVLENLLALALVDPLLSSELNIGDLVRDLLTPQPNGLYDKAYDVYIELLRLIWNHYSLNPAFCAEKSYGQRLRGAYIFADRLLDAMVQESPANPGYMEVGLGNLRRARVALSERVNLLMHRQDVDADVASPVIASRWRTVAGATLQILDRATDKLGDSAPDILETLQQFMPMTDPFSASSPFAFEPLAFSDLPPGPDNSPVSNQGRIIAMRLKSELSGSEHSTDDSLTEPSMTEQDEPDPSVVAGYMTVLGRFPIPIEWRDRAIEYVDRILDTQVLTRDTKLSFFAAAAVVPRLPGDIAEIRRKHLLQIIVEAVGRDASLWGDAVDLSVQLNRLGEPTDRVEAILETLNQLARLIPQDSKVRGGFVAFARRIEGLIPATSWPSLWRTLETDAVPNMSREVCPNAQENPKRRLSQSA